ncbi:MAG: Mur ligase family protein, partial [Halobacteriovoraceae bacterium]|nr:Mur ligase family protein [Halobacteriovoraceae bacterium]
MIKNVLSSIDLGTFTGVTNVVQNVEEKDILLLPCSSEAQLNDLIEKNLDENFSGLLVSPFKPEREVNNIKLEKKEIKELEEYLIDYYYPLQANLKYVGVTGTNGKTSVCWLFSEIGKVLGKEILYMGTPGVFLSGKMQSEKILTTTPSYLDLRKLAHRYKNRFDAIVLEVSSHALAQERLKDISLTSGAWTNFTQDHLDFHKTMEDYFEAKKKIVSLTTSKKIITPQNSPLSERLGGSSVPAVSLEEVSSDSPPIFSSGFTKENLEVALSLYESAFGENVKDLNLTEVSLPPGRFQVVSHRNKDFIVDYAHTPDALLSLL